MPFFADSADDPKYAGIMALAAGMLEGKPGLGIMGSLRAMQESRESQSRRKLDEMQLEKGGMELQNMRDAVESNRGYREAVRRHALGAAAAPPMGMAATPGGAEAVQQQSMVGAPKQVGGGPDRTSVANDLFQRAQIASQYGKIDEANKLLEHATKLLPDIHGMEVLIDPDSKKPVNVITFKDGTQRVSTFGAKPKIHWVDTGSKVQAIDENSMEARGGFNKTMTPGEIARLNFEKNQPKGQYDPERGILVDPRTGTASPVTQNGQPIGLKDKGLNDSQAKANLFGSRAQEANKILGQMQGQYWPSAVNAKMSAESLPLIGGAAGAAGNMVLSEEGQQAEQAQRDFINAVLRRESGAVISPTEFTNGQKQYFPQPNDGEKVLAQKARNRQLAVEGILAEVPTGRRGVPSLTNPTGSPSGGGREVSGAVGGIDPSAIAAELARRRGGK